MKDYEKEQLLNELEKRRKEIVRLQSNTNVNTKEDYYCEGKLFEINNCIELIKAITINRTSTKI